jgi:galactokinase
VVHSEVQRQLAHSGYADRRSECRAIYELVGSWSDLNLTSLNRLPSPLQQRARHIVTENQRVRDFVAAMAADHIITAGQILTESHASLRDDFEVSLPAVDTLIDTIAVVPGVRGARLIGGGFGGCVLVLHEPNTEVAIPGHRSWSVEPSEGALGRITTN